MKEPKLNDLRFSKKQTKSINAKMAKDKKIKITINLDVDSLDALKNISGKTGVPYQRLLNQLVKEALEGQHEAESRIDRLEKEIQKIKRHLAA